MLRMRRTVDWEGIEKSLASYYDAWTGRPSFAPALLVRMLVLEYYADLSDREVEEQAGYNLLYRDFLGLGMDDRVPDSTTLVRFRDRIGEEGIRKVFAEVNRQLEAAGLVGSDRRLLDGVHLWAKVARASWVGLMRSGREKVYDALGRVKPEKAEMLRKGLELAEPAPEPRGEDALRVERERTERLLDAVRSVQDERVRDRADLLAALLADRDRPVSFDDPDARWGYKKEDMPFCGYKAHEAIDPESRIITSVDVVPGNANEAVRTADLLAGDTVGREESAVIIADALYNNSTTVQQVEEAKGRPCFAGLSAERKSDDFEYSEQTDEMICPAGKHSIGKVRVGAGDLYYFSVGDCNRCPFRETCLTPGEREGSAQPRRRIYLSDVRKKKRVAGEAGREWRRSELRLRGRIEAKFDEQVNRHGMRHARYWGLAKVTIQVVLTAITVNLKRAAKLILQRSAQGPEEVARAMSG
ncbi:MAG: transposase [Planctomycetes bacterium]|nr:transposase [Planctomycetota bacterium]